MDIKAQTLLGFDFGTRFIGVAVGQTVTKTAKPLTTIKAKKGRPNWTQIANLIKIWNPNKLIVGLPINMDGTEQKFTKVTEQFCNELKRRFDLPVFKIDERLTTIEARSQIFAANGYRALTKVNIDAKSAQLILQSWLNEHYTRL